MGALFSYSIAVSILLACMYLCYKWLLAGQNQHAYNRAVLLGILALAFAAPFITPMLAHKAPEATIAAIEMTPILIPSAAVEHAADSGINLWRIAIWAYSAGILLVLCSTVATAIRLASIIRSGEKIPAGSQTLVILDRDGIAPFSWCRYIVMSRKDYDSAADAVIAHESEHLRLRHWLDLMLAQAVIAVLWYNPAAWLMREELKTVHEYQADSRVLSAGFDARQYQLLLIKKAVGARFPSLANSLNHSNLKKRITMMYKSKTSVRGRVKALALVPAIAVALVALNVPAVANAVSSISGTEMLAAAPAPQAKTQAKTDNKVTKKAAPAQTMDDVVVVGYASGDVKQASSAPKASAAKADETEYAWDKRASFPGGEGEMYRFIGMNIRYPEEAMKESVQGNVVVGFTVGADGSISDVKVLRPVHPSLDAEAVRVIKSMPLWEPALKDDKPIAMTYTTPIRFKLSKDTPPSEKNIVDMNKIKKEFAPAIFLDGKRITPEEMNKLNPDDIARIDVFKDENPEYPNGRLIITSKK